MKPGERNASVEALGAAQGSACSGGGSSLFKSSFSLTSRGPWAPLWVLALTVSEWLLFGKFCKCPESVFSY